MQNSTVTLSTKIYRNPDVAWRILGQNFIAITPSDNKVHRFNETGAYLWEALEEQHLSIEELAQKIESHFEMEKKSAKEDILQFTAEIIKRGLVHIDS